MLPHVCNELLPSAILAWWAGWQRAHHRFWDLYSLSQVTDTMAAFYTNSCPQGIPQFSATDHTRHTCLQSNMMDKSWREKSSLMYCSVRVKHSIANLQAATQEQNVIISSQDQTSANLSNIRESWISFHAGARPLLRPNLSPTPPALLWEGNQVCGSAWVYSTLCLSPCPRRGDLAHPAGCTSHSD